MNKPLSLVLILLFINASAVLADPTPTRKDTVVIPFEYKQSALYQSFTLEVIDSVISILLRNPPVTLSIEGYAHMDEGSDTICYWLSYNRAQFIKEYVLGRGVDSSRIILLKGYGNRRPNYKSNDKEGRTRNCRAEIMLNYPILPKGKLIFDKDGDGMADDEDDCPDEYGSWDLGGCPNRDAVIVPFEIVQSALTSKGYQVLDSVILVLRKNPTYTISISGHAYKEEGVKSVCERLSVDRADIVKNYLLSRYVAATRIDGVKTYGKLIPLNAGLNPRDIARNYRVEIIFDRHEP